MMDAREAAQEVIKEARSQPWGLAVATVSATNFHIELSPGVDLLSDQTLFQFGSITKTMTGFLLADCVVNKKVKLDTTVGAIIGTDAGKAADISLYSLATHTSGLPRLPPNLDLKDTNSENPYKLYAESHLLESLHSIQLASSKSFEYSNYGFMLLGMLLSRISGLSYGEMAQERIFKPFNMSTAVVGVPYGPNVSVGYNGLRQVPWWQDLLPGAGGIAGSINDLVSYLQGYLAPLNAYSEAISLVTAKHEVAGSAIMGLGWVYEGDMCWHNGGTGGFRSFVALHLPSKSAIAILVNSSCAEFIDNLGLRVLASLIRN